MIAGLGGRVTKSAVPVMRIHYTADPHKRPGTPEGDAWLTQAVQGYPGGVKCPRWRKEMEIEYGALGGTKLFPLWEQWRTNGRILVAPFQPIGYRLYGSYDHGWRHPACYLVHGINGDGEMVTLWEFFGAHVPYQHIARIIKGESVRVPACGAECHPEMREFPGNPFAGQELYKVADPSIWAEDQQQSDGTMKSTAKLFMGEKVFFLQGTRGGDTTFAEWMIGHWWADPLKPLWRITTACPNLDREIGLQRHKDISPQVALNKAQPEQLVDRDNDAFDAWKYFGMRFPPTPQGASAEQKGNTFAWWRKMSRTAVEGQAASTFRIQRECVG